MQDDRLVDGSLRPLIRFMEHTYNQNIAMKKMLESIPGIDWRTEVIKLMAIEDVSGGRFAKISAALDHPENLHVAIQEFLSIKSSI